MKPPTFSELPNEWTPVFPSSELRDKPVPFTLAGERLVFFRGAQGAVVESSQPPRVPSPKDESNVPTDKATLRFRTWYYDTVMPGIQR
jgi:hypothetical protein